ncbi:MAG: hypothetical protein FJ304_03825 [Planctomycetes bacterium]|nr:hypothetical protein [Planctomycetota bacterium]
MTRCGHRYYYRSRWVNGRCVKEYVGTGAVAEVTARIDAVAGAQRVALRTAREARANAVPAVAVALAPFYALVESVLAVVFAQEGYHVSRKNWRKKRGFAPPLAEQIPPTPAPEPTGPDGGPLPGPELVARARAGDVPAAQAVRARADGPGPLEFLGGDVAAVAISHIIARMVGPDSPGRAALEAKMGAIRAELVGSSATVLERLVADRVVATWLDLHKMEGEYAFADAAEARAQQPAFSAAQRRYFGAIDELMKVKARAAAR